MKLSDCVTESNESLDKALDEAIVELLADSGIAFRSYRFLSRIYLNIKDHTNEYPNTCIKK